MEETLIFQPTALMTEALWEWGWQCACVIQLTCGYKKNACTEEYIICLVVRSPYTDTQPAKHQQGGAEDGEHTEGPNNTCREAEEVEIAPE